MVEKVKEPNREELKKRVLKSFKKYLEAKNENEKNDMIIKAIEELKKKLQ
jgi:hypothetical protein